MSGPSAKDGITADPRGPLTAPLAPHEQLGDHMARFESMDRDQLLAQARLWCGSAIIARDKQHHILNGTDAMLADYQHRLARVWALIDVNRKTVSTEALLDVLRGAS